MKNGLKSLLHCMVHAFILLTVVPTLALGQGQGKKTEDLVKGSDVIVVGKVGRKNSEWNEDKSRIQTRISITVDETIKGAAPGKTIVIVVPGGEVDGVGELYSHTARFTEEEDVVVFAKKNKKGEYRVTGGEFGKVLVEKDKATGKLIVEHFGTLDQFTAKVKDVVKAQGPK